MSTCLAVVTLPLFRRLFSLVLCGLLFANSSLCYNLLGNDTASAASSGLEAASSEITGRELGNPQEIAVPPIIREAPVDLQNALPDDFIVSRQTPYSSGRNEILIVSPSTGTEQRFEINLPETSDSFRLYQASFDKVVINDPIRVVGGESLPSSDQVQAMLESFSIKFGSDNFPESVVLADGTAVEFSATEAIIRSVDGQVIETVTLSNSLSSDEDILSEKSSERILAHRHRSNDCKSRIRNQIYNSGQRAGNISDALKNAISREGKAFAWTLTYGKRALEDSLVAGTRNQTLQQIACKPPVQCNQPERYEGGSVIRTDLFQLPGGRNQRVNIQYEFYEIEDRMEIYVEGRLIDSIPKGSGSTGGSGDVPLNISDGVAFLGIKLIGNEDSNTEWWYTISCSGESVPQQLLEAREIARRLRVVYPGWKESLVESDSCPCTTAEADRSDRFVEDSEFVFHNFVEHYHPGADTAYRSVAGVVQAYPSQAPDLQGAAPLYPGQQCAYDTRGTLITGGTAAGTPDAYAPEITPTNSRLHTTWDTEPADVMTLREYHQTWTPNNGNSCPINVINLEEGAWRGKL